MPSISDFEDYQTQLDKHQDYILLNREYSHTEIFKEIILFMDSAFPEWTTNRGIGFWAAEFVLTAIQNLEHLYEDINNSSIQVLKDVYMSLVVDYKITKKQFTSVVIDTIIHNFEIEYNELLDENEYLPINDFKALYDELYNVYEIKILNKVTYNFMNEEFPIL
ncbi:hypothetical protein [Olleya namhaensis]|uniref:Uncharacterized protein n=1 Tax=Olleya namhaensis TaxID=1144750 RepID=A0A1I3MSF4_9FLAO|nr:hypothetical protein [Olleya namhaensis]SFJ00034.1 hypothetical protein SAMN05443431_103289 [Olleya namhaensis]